MSPDPRLSDITTPTRLRTQRAILETAAKVFPGAPNSSLADIGQIANVSRSTIHRYYADRSALVRAVAVYAYELCDAAIVDANRESLNPVETLRNIAANHLDIGPLMMFLYQDPAISADEEFWKQLREGGDPIDPILLAAAGPKRTLPIEWLRRSYWGLLYVGWEAVMDRSMTTSEIVHAIMESMQNGVLGSTPSTKR